MSADSVTVNLRVCKHAFARFARAARRAAGATARLASALHRHAASCRSRRHGVRRMRDRRRVTVWYRP